MDQPIGCLGRRRGVSSAPILHLYFQADTASVRRALQTAMAVFGDMGLDPDRSGAVEIVLAEVLNNVAEHAYRDTGRGLVELAVEKVTGALAFRIRDEGVAMPDGAVPEGTAPEISGTADDLPEGGFGWFLIRELTRDLAYRRVADRNELTFRITLEAGDAGV